MKTSGKKTGKKTGKAFGEGITWINDAFAVDSVNNYSDTVCFFNLWIKTAIGIMCVNGCKIISNDDGSFISFPSYKGSNDKYYNHCYAEISDEIKDQIIEAIESQI